MSLAVCGLGHHEMSPEDLRGAFVGVHGWQKPGKGANMKSGSSIVLRTRLPEVACATCVTSWRNGIDPTTQKGLFP